MSAIFKKMECWYGAQMTAYPAGVPSGGPQKEKEESLSLQSVSRGRDEVEADVDARVRNRDTVDSRLGVHERLELAVHKLDDLGPM
jgi:hypothetical protein